MNDCIVELGAGRDGPPRPPVPGNSVESKQARQGASALPVGGVSAFQLSFRDNWNAEMEQSESHAHRTPSAIATTATQCVPC